MLKMVSILLSSEKPDVLVSFYTKVFDKEPEWQGEVGDFVGFKLGDGYMVIGPHDKVHGANKNPERIIYNFEAEDVKGEFDRLRTIPGVKVVQAPYSPDEDTEAILATFADPDGNYFQLASPMTM